MPRKFGAAAMCLSSTAPAPAPSVRSTFDTIPAQTAVPPSSRWFSAPGRPRASWSSASSCTVVVSRSDCSSAGAEVSSVHQCSSSSEAEEKT